MLVRAELADYDLRRQAHESSIQPEDLIQSQLLVPRNMPDTGKNSNHFDQTN